MNPKTFFKKQNLSPLIQVVSSLIIIALGIVTLTLGIFWDFFYLVAIILLGTDLVTRTFAFFTSKRTRFDWFGLLFVLGELALVVILLLHGLWFKQIMTLVFGVWIVFNACCRFFAFVIAYRDRLSIRVYLFLDGLFSLIFGVILLSNWTKTTYLVNNLIGYYMIIFACFQLFSAINLLSNNKIKQSIRFPLPIFIAAFLPSQVVRTANELVKNDQSILSKPDEVADDTNKVFVNFYMKVKGHEQFGHVDIAYEGKIYSYGCHDPFNRMSQMLYGDGVLIVANQSEFIDFEINQRDKVMVQFECELNSDQIRLFKQGLADLMAKTVVFDFPYKRDSDCRHYLTRMHAANVEATYYKFTEGYFKTYFVLTTNCVLLVETLFQKTGINLFNINGIIVPGTYYDVLNTAYNQENSFVLSKKIFRKTLD